MRYLLNIQLPTGSMRQILVERKTKAPNRRAFTRWCAAQLKRQNITGRCLSAELL